MEYVRKIILIFTVLAFALSMLWSNVYASEQKVYVLILHYDKGEVAKKSLVVTIGLFTDILDQPENGYLLQVKSFDNKILYAQKFSFDLIGQQISIPNQKSFVAEEEDQELIFPFFSNGKEIEIYDPQNKEILTIPVGHFAEITPTPSQVSEPARSAGDMSLLWISAISLFSAAVLGVYFYVRNRKSSQNSL